MHYVKATRPVWGKRRAEREIAMAQSVPKKTPRGRSVLSRGREPDVLFTSHAQHSLAVRGITTTDVLQVLKHGKATNVTTDSKTGNFVYQVGNLRVVARHDNDDKIIVLTAVHDDEIEG
jgi:Domain of unknown function (DUF4258)